VTRHIFRPAAADVEVIHRWYERERRGLGNEFLAEARRVVDSVMALPNGYPVIHRDTRRALVRRFRYGLPYRAVDDLIVFVGCFHTSREPHIVEKAKVTVVAGEPAVTSDGASRRR